jgi:hypothetical protein
LRWLGLAHRAIDPEPSHFLNFVIVVGVPSGRFDQHDLGGPIGIAPAPDHAAGEEFAQGTERRFAGFFVPRVDMMKRSSICFHPARPAAFIARRGLHRAA